MGVLAGTLFFVLAGVIGSCSICCVPALKADKGLSTLLIWTAATCMWLMWIITYMMQLNPLIDPKPMMGE